MVLGKMRAAFAFSKSMYHQANKDYQITDTKTASSKRTNYTTQTHLSQDEALRRPSHWQRRKGTKTSTTKVVLDGQGLEHKTSLMTIPTMKSHSQRRKRMDLKLLGLCQRQLLIAHNFIFPNTNFRKTSSRFWCVCYCP